jgi:hypothetical protein
MPRGKGGGRKLKRPGAPLSENINFRLRPELKEKLKAAAEEAGRTVSEEVQYRLEQSFAGHDWITRDLAEDIAGAMINHLKGPDGEAWLNKFRKTVASVPALALAVDQTTPKDDTKPE